MWMAPKEKKFAVIIQFKSSNQDYLHTFFNTILYKGASTYYVTSMGGGGFSK